ncbi:dysbindin, partial [Nephila pilipes]
KLGEEHAHKVFEYEKKQENILKERQHTFQEAFEEEVEQYKKHGLKNLRQRVSSNSSANSVSLEDIDLEEDASALDEFLGDEAADEARGKAEIQGSCETETSGTEVDNKVAENQSTN